VASPQPIFILSVARTGSTLLQRVLGAYDEVATVAEPWVLIPQVYALRDRGVAAEYTHPLLVDAIEDFCERLPDGRGDYLTEVRELVLRLYARASGEAQPRYFLDKTPPYFFILDELFDLFPDGKFIFLWRNPLSVVASLIEWDEGHWDPARYKENLFNGIVALTHKWAACRDRAHAVRYEDLVTGDTAVWRGITDYLALEFDPRTLSSFASVELDGRMGDPFGVQRYAVLSTEPLTKWKRTLANPLRQAWCRRYLRWLGRERLALMGYELDALLDELAEVPRSTRELRGDAVRLTAALLREPVRARARRSVGIGGASSFRYILDPRAGHEFQPQRRPPRAPQP
jgi:Sulfotransferase family